MACSSKNVSVQYLVVSKCMKLFDFLFGWWLMFLKVLCLIIGLMFSLKKKSGHLMLFIGVNLRDGLVFPNCNCSRQ